MNVSYHPDGADPSCYPQQIFSATLLPYRSLSARGFQIMLLLLLLLWALISMVFIQTGAWFAIAIIALDIALIYCAFRLNYYAARQREEITLSREQLQITRITASGRSRSYQFNPFRTRFHIIRKDDIGIVEMQLHADGQILDIGKFLPPDEREHFANAFHSALIRSRR